MRVQDGWVAHTRSKLSAYIVSQKRHRLGDKFLKAGEMGDTYKPRNLDDKELYACYAVAWLDNLEKAIQNLHDHE